VTLPAPSSPGLIRWRYHFTDFILGSLLATLPMRDVSLSDVLSGAASGTGVVPLHDQVLARQPFAATVPRRSCLWAERQLLDAQSGQVVTSSVLWGGIVMSRERNHAARTMKLGLVTWPAYLARRLVGDGFYTQVDKFTIARSLAAYCVDQPHLDTAEPGIYGASPHVSPLFAGIASAPFSGVLADRTYLGSDLKPGLEALTELGNSGAGFDWRFDPFMATPGDLRTFQVRMALGYPRLGRVRPADLRWSTEEADSRQRWGFVSDLTISEDGSAANNQVTALGAGSGPDQIRATATSWNELYSGYPLYETSLGSSSQDDRTLDTVAGKANGALAAGLAGSVRVTGVTVRGDLAPAVHTYQLGDDITLRLGESTNGQPATLVGQLVGRTIEPEQPGRTETVKLDVQGTVSG